MSAASRSASQRQQWQGTKTRMYEENHPADLARRDSVRSVPFVVRRD